MARKLKAVQRTVAAPGTATPGWWTAVRDRYYDRFDPPRERWLIEKRTGGYKTLIVGDVYADPDHIGGPEFQGTKEGNAHLLAAAPVFKRWIEQVATEAQLDARLPWYGGATIREVLRALEAPRGA